MVGNFNVSSGQRLKFSDLLVTFKDQPVTFPCLTLCLRFTKIIYKYLPTLHIPYTCDYGSCIMGTLSLVQKPDPSCLQFVRLYIFYTINVIIAHHLANKSSGYVGLVYVTILRVTKVAECGKSEYY